MEQKIPIRKKGEPTQYIPVSEIEYIETDRAYCIIHFKNKPQKTVTGNLNDYCRLLNGSSVICRVHRSYAVNIDEIGWYDNHHLLILKSEKIIPISEDGKKALLEKGFIL